MEINAIRKKIDELDDRLVALLNERLMLASEIGRLKRGSSGSIYVAEREDAVLQKVTSINRGPLQPAALRAIYREIMSAAIALEKPLVVGYLGPELTNTHQAALKKFGSSVEYEPLATISDIFTAIERGEVDHGVIPIENSTEGSVREALDHFVDSDLKIAAQVNLEISHALISHAPLEKITRVCSKDQALAQCREWLKRHLPHAQLVDTPSTTAAVHIASEEREHTAAVASRLAAEACGVPVVVDNIQDMADNTTRFFVLGRQSSGPVGGGRDITSLIISMGDDAASRPGALLRILMPFSCRGISLTKLESRPNKRRSWDYYFFIDVTGHHEDPPVQQAIAELRTFCQLVKWLGSYPAATD